MEGPAPRPEERAQAQALVLQSLDPVQVRTGLAPPLTVIIKHSLAEEGDPDGVEVTSIGDAAALTAWAEGLVKLRTCPDDFSAPPPEGTCRWMNGLQVIGEPTCSEGGCCRFRPAGEDHIPLLHNSLFLDQICYDTAGAVSQIAFLDGD